MNGARIPAEIVGDFVYCPLLAYRKWMNQIASPGEGRESAVEPIRNAILRFHRVWTKSLSEEGGAVRIRKLRTILREAKLNVSREFSNIALLNGKVKRVLSSIGTDILNLANERKKGKQVEATVLVDSYFGGIPRFDVYASGKHTEGSCDIVSEGNGAPIVWKIFPKNGCDHDRKSAIMEVAALALAMEDQSHSECRTLVAEFGSSPVFVPFHPKLREELEDVLASLEEISDSNGELSHADCGICRYSNLCVDAEESATEVIERRDDVSQPRPDSEPLDGTEVTDSTTQTEYIGRIIQNPKAPLVLSADKKRLYGHIDEDHRSEVSEDMILIAQKADDEHSARVFCLVKQIKSFPHSVHIVTRGTQEFVSGVELSLTLEVSNGYVGPVRNDDLSSFYLRFPTESELTRYYGIPVQGVPLGLLKESQESVSKTPFRLDEEQLYQSIFVCGAKRTGKTTFIKWLIHSLSSRKGIPMDQLPALAILDLEGEFQGIGRGGQLKPETQNLLDRLRVGSQREATVLRLSTMPERANVTLTLGEIEPEHFAYFVPNLTLATIVRLERIVKDVFGELQKRGITITAQCALKQISTTSWRGRAIHPSQRDAIIRVTESNMFEIFDQPDLDPLNVERILAPGKITVIDVHDLTDDQQRTVALYLLSVLHRYKIKRDNSTGLLLFFDEAHRLFPRAGDLKKDYITRLGKFVSEIVHRGRRRRYGILLATQYPKDVSREISDLCDTTVIFRIAGNKTWLRENAGPKEALKEVLDLPTGEALVIARGLTTTKPAKVCVPNVC